MYGGLTWDRSPEATTAITNATQAACDSLGMFGKAPLYKAAVDEICRHANTDSVLVLKGQPGSGKRMFARLFNEAAGPRPFYEIDAAELRELSLQAFESWKGETSLWIWERTIYISNAQVLPVGVLERISKLCQKRRRVRLLLSFNMTDTAPPGEMARLVYGLRDCTIVHAPSLTERPGDASVLCRTWLKSFVRDPGLWDADHETLCSEVEQRHWRDNVRSLKNFCSMAAFLPVADLTAALQASRFKMEAAELAMLPELGPGFSMETYFSTLRRRLMNQALREAGGNKSAAARMLGVSPQAVHSYYKSQEQATPFPARDHLTTEATEHALATLVQ